MNWHALHIKVQCSLGKNAVLKGLSHEMDLAFDDIDRFTRPVLNFFLCDPMVLCIMQKVYFLRLMRVCVVFIVLMACT
jgi:hypothetical protein